MWNRICVVRMPRRKNHFFLSRRQCVSSVFFRRLTTNVSWLSLKGCNIAYVFNSE